MNRAQKQSMTELMNQMEGVTLREAHGKSFHFPFHLTETMEHTSIEALDLSVRANNALHRAGFETIGALVHAMDEGFSLSKVRSCGARTIREIMESLFFYQYGQMSQERQKQYLIEVVIWNVERHKMAVG